MAGLHNGNPATIKIEMRDLVFKNLVSTEKKRRIFSSSETVEKQGMKSVIRRHFVCLLKELGSSEPATKPSNYLYVLKSKNTKELKQKFFCRVKGSMYAQYRGKSFLVLYMHSLKIIFTPLAYIPETGNGQ